MDALKDRGVRAALAAALFFGAGTPAAKLLLGPLSPWLLAGVLYLGSGVGLAIFRRVRHYESPRLAPSDTRWLALAILAGGLFAPVLLMWGLAQMHASDVSLLLNAEGVFTALLAWFVYGENFDRRIFAGMALIVGGAIVLSWPEEMNVAGLLPALAVLAACLAWAVDNNLTRRVALTDATFIAMTKGLSAGTVNVAIAVALGANRPELGMVLVGAAIGFFSYGVSLALFIVALRYLGTSRTGAYFSIAPFAGAVLSLVLFNDSVTLQLAVAGVLMAAGVWLHLTERHEHLHAHEPIEHDHAHVHDEHHKHTHDQPVSGFHTHRHQHEPLTHSHPHYPDVHHRHRH